MSLGWFDDLVQQIISGFEGEAASEASKTSPVVGFLLSTLWESGGRLDNEAMDPMSGAPSANPFTTEPDPDNPYETGPDNPYDTGTDDPFDPGPGDPSTTKEDLRLADNDSAGAVFGWDENGPYVKLQTQSYGVTENAPVGLSDAFDSNPVASPVNQAPLDLTGAPPIAVDVPPPTPTLPPTPTSPPDAGTADEFGGYWRSLPLAAIPSAALFTPSRLPPMLPGTTFYGGQVQFPSPSPPPRLPAQLAGFVGWVPPSRNDPIPYLMTVTDTGSTALNYLVGGLYSWTNVSRLATNIVLVDLQGALGVLADVNTWLDEHGMNPNAIPGDVGPAIVESGQYLSAGAGRWLGSLRLDLAAAQDTRASVATGDIAWGAPVETLFPAPKGPDIPFRSIWRETYPIAQGTPAGFSSPAEFQRFSSGMYQQFSASQIAGNAYFQGSSVTGYGYGTAYVPGYGYEAKAPFDFMRISDYDLALVSPELVQKAEQLGISLSGQGTRTAPLSQADLASLGLDQIANSLSAAAGRPVNIMLYQSDSAVQRAPSILAPR